MTEPFTAPQKYVDGRLHEWSVWVRRGRLIPNGWPSATAFGKRIKPDPMPAREAINELRAFETDLRIAKLHKRQKRLIKVFYLDTRPQVAKAVDLRLTDYGYDKTRRHLLEIVYHYLKIPS
jgi:hypothetical protein